VSPRSTTFLSLRCARKPSKEFSKDALFVVFVKAAAKSFVLSRWSNFCIFPPS
jgi:hypothetical protein